MKEDASGRRQRAVMATDAEWERIGREGMLEGLTDPGAANRWKAVGPAGCCSASPFDPPESKRIKVLPRRSASNLHA